MKQLRRQSTIPNAFAEVIKNARVEDSLAEKSTKSPPKSVRLKENTKPSPIETSQVVNTPHRCSIRKRRSAPSEIKSQKKVDEDPDKLKKENVQLRRENEALRARLQARQYVEEEQSTQQNYHKENHHKKKNKTYRYSSYTSRSTRSRRSVGSVSRAEFLLYSSANTQSQPFVAFAIYGAAARDGECAAKLPSALGHRYRPIQLCAIGSSDFEWAALPNFVFPDGIALELVTKGSAPDFIYSNSTARIAALTRGYLVSYITISAERFARPHAVQRTLRRGDIDAHRMNTEYADSPLAAALHLLPPVRLPPLSDDSNQEELVVLGQRAYVALTLGFDRCADCLRFLRRTAARDRRADVHYLKNDLSTTHSDRISPTPVSSSTNKLKNTRWHADWDNDWENDDLEEDDHDQISEFLRGRSIRSHLSFQAPARLESFVCRARDDPRVWTWLTQEEPKVVQSADNNGSGRRDILRLTSQLSDPDQDDDEAFYWNVTPLDAHGKPKPLVQPSSRQWSLAALLALVPAQVIARAIGQILRERSLVVVADDVARAGAVALGLSEAVAPLSWQGTVVMSVPANEIALLGSPVPFIAGCSTATAAVAHVSFAESDDPSTNPLHDLCVLYIDRQHDAQFVVPYFHNLYSSSDELHDSRANSSTTSSRNTDDEDNSNESLFHAEMPAPPRLLTTLKAAQAKTQRGADVIRLLCGLDSDELEAVHAATTALREFILDLLDDLGRDDPDAYRNYGQQDLLSGIFNFEPSWLIAKLKAKFDLQAQLANTQMLHSYIDQMASPSSS